MQVERGRLGIAGGAQAVVGACHDQFVGVEAEGDAIFAPRRIDRDESRVLDLDPQLLEGRDEPVLAIFVAFEQAGESSHHRSAGYRAAIVEPGPVGGDPHAALAGPLGRPAFDRRQFARRNLLGDLGERQFGQLGWGFVGHCRLRWQNAGNDSILPESGRGTMRSMVEGHGRLIGTTEVRAAGGAPPPRATRAVPLPEPGRKATARACPRAAGSRDCGSAPATARARPGRGIPSRRSARR